MTSDDAKIVEASFLEHYSRVMSASDADSAARTLLAQPKYPVSGDFRSYPFTVDVKIDFLNGRREKFEGKAYGTFTFGIGAFGGELYTPNLDRVLKETRDIFVGIFVTYANVTFFDRNSSQLGTAHFGGLQISNPGLGGGRGSWWLPVSPESN